MSYVSYTIYDSCFSLSGVCTWALHQAWFSCHSLAVVDTLPAMIASLPGTRTVPGTEQSAWTSWCKQTGQFERLCVWLDQVIKVPFCTFDLSKVKVSACPVTLSRCCVIQCWQTADGCDCKHSLCTLGVLIIQERYASSLESRYRSNK